jgi:uncharacterized protein YjdB
MLRRRGTLFVVLLALAVVPIAVVAGPPSSPGIDVLVHLQDVGDTNGRAGEWVGTKGQSRRLEGFALTMKHAPAGLGLEYMCHVQDVGDTAWVSGGEFCGSRGQSRRVEGFAVRLTGPAAQQYRVRYACHLQDIGDTAEIGDGEFCGTRGQSRRLEAFTVRIEPAPSKCTAYRQVGCYWMENTSGNFCWVPSPSPVPTIHECAALDSCDGGGGRSGGGCYKWADCSDCARAPWPKR